MSADQRYSALRAVSLETLERLADSILADGAEVEVVAGPEVCSAPVRVPIDGDDRATSVLAHVALTTCTVRLGGTRGDAVRTGRDLVGALAAAICDAEVERSGRWSSEVAALVRDVESTHARAARARASLVAATRLGEGA